MPLQQIYIEVTMKIQKLFNIIIHLICFCLLWEQYSAISQLLHCILRLMGIKFFSIVAVIFGKQFCFCGKIIMKGIYMWNIGWA